MGLLDRPSAPERWGSSVVSFTAARLSHEMTWPKVNLASRNSGAGVLFALCVLCPPRPLFFPLLELPPSRGALSAFLACWGEKKKNKLVDVFHLEFVSLSLPLSFFIHPPPICLGWTETKKMKEKKQKTQAQTFFCFIRKTHVHETLSPAGSPGLWKKRALWWRAACWACSKHTHSASAERSWERRGLGEHRGLKTAASDPAYNSHFTLLPRHHYNAQGRKKSQWQSPGTLPEKEPL